MIIRIIFYAAANLAAFFGIAYILPGFHLSGNIYEALAAAGILTLLNIFVRPILKFLFIPFILLTLGLFTIVLNAILLYAVDILSPGITIDGIGTLVIATIIVSIINSILGWIFYH